jgi:hypothetical protein
MTTDRAGPFERCKSAMRPSVGNSAELPPRAKTVKYAATVGAAPACGRGKPDVAWSESGAGRSFRLASFGCLTFLARFAGFACFACFACFAGMPVTAVVPIRFF